MRILLVEDDEDIGDGIQKVLKAQGHTVDWLKDGISAEHALSSENFDAVVLDIGLPRLSGLELLRNIRREGSDVPVLLLTARDTIKDRIEGLDSGADDYLVKPFDVEELQARIRAIQRRRSARADPLITYGDIVIDPASHIVTLKGKSLSLSRREFALLQKFLENPGRALSRDQLTQTLYGWGEEVDSNALEVHIHNLRKKFGSKFIHTIRGIGYMVEKIE